MLEMGLKIQNFNIIGGYSGILDDLGIVSNCIMGFSFNRLTKNFNDDVVYVRRSADNQKEWFGFDSDGVLETANILSFVGVGNDGYIERYNNQLKVTNQAYQTNVNYQPKIVNAGVFCSDGILFDGVNDYLIVDKYNEINITSPILNCYFNRKNQVGNTFLFSLNLDAVNMQYGIRCNGGDIFFHIQSGGRISKLPAIGNQIMGNWFGLNANELMLKDTNSENFATYSFAPSTERPHFRIGCKTNSVDGLTNDYFYDGNLKTLLIFNNDQSSNFDNFVSYGL